MPGSDNSFKVNLVEISQKHQIAIIIANVTRITNVTGGSRLYTVEDYRSGEEDRTGEKAKAIKIYQLSDGKLLRTIPISYSSAESLKTAPNGKAAIIDFRRCTSIPTEKALELHIKTEPLCTESA